MQNASTYLSCDVFERLAVNLPARDQQKMIEAEPSEQIVPQTKAATPKQFQAFPARKLATRSEKRKLVGSLTN